MHVNPEIVELVRRRKVNYGDIVYMFRRYKETGGSQAIELIRKEPDGTLVSFGKSEAEDTVIASHRTSDGSGVDDREASAKVVPQAKSRRKYKTKRSSRRDK